MHAQLLEQLRRNPIVSALAEVARVNEVTAAEMHADVHVGWDLADAVVV